MIGAEKGTLGELNHNDIFAYQFRHVFCVLKRTVSMRRFFLSTHNNVWVGRDQNFHNFCTDVNDKSIFSH